MAGTVLQKRNTEAVTEDSHQASTKPMKAHLTQDLCQKSKFKNSEGMGTYPSDRMFV